MWLYRPSRHKSEHHGKARIIALGPRAQNVVREFLTTETTTYLFSPRTIRPSANERYTRSSYLNAVRRGCERAFGMPENLRNIPKRTTKAGRKLTEAERARRMDAAREWRREHCWCPLQLRHTAATEIRRVFDLESAQAVLGHSKPDTTTIYAERDLDRARAVVLQIG